MKGAPRRAPSTAPLADHLPTGALRWYSSGRAALYDALTRLGAPKGAEVMMPAYIAAGVIDPVRALGLTPCFYQTRNDLLFDGPALAEALGKHPAVRAVIVLHPMGRAQDIAALAGDCRRKGVLLVEDCAQGLFGRLDDGRPLGSQGDVALFSLPKFLGTADGALTVSSQAGPGPSGRSRSVRAAGAWHKAHLLANRCLHAAVRPALESLLLSLSGALHERYYALAGADFRPSAPARSTLAAAEDLDPADFIRRRRRNVERLYAGLRSKHLSLVYPDDRPGWVPMAVPARVAGAERVEVVRRARVAGLLLASLTQRWDQTPAGAEGDVFAAERDYIARHVLIPINEHIDDESMDRVVRVLNEL
ncbi:MAG: DegT/DnrJ/EryC1/StrS aminotransferase family protein [Elusimicrobia bacterium]|nr:DegT/DnrJ/EryC1/StrS aminotransferase family protein [Elusimicrobiota bacterium]